MLFASNGNSTGAILACGAAIGSAVLFSLAPELTPVQPNIPRPVVARLAAQATFQPQPVLFRAHAFTEQPKLQAAHYGIPDRSVASFQPQPVVFRQWNPPTSPQGGQTFFNLDQGPEIQPPMAAIFGQKASILVDAVAPAPAPVPSAQTPAGRSSKRERYIARFKDQEFQFNTIKQVEEFVAAVSAREAKKPKAQRAPVKIKLTPGFIEEMKPFDIPAPRRMEYMPTGAAMAQLRRIDYSMARILAMANEKKKPNNKDDDDDEALLWLM